MTAPIQLPMAWYSSIDAVAAQWQCHRDQVLYLFDAGLLIPGLLLPKYLYRSMLKPAPLPTSASFWNHIGR